VVMDTILAAGGDKIERIILTGCSGTIIMLKAVIQVDLHV